MSKSIQHSSSNFHPYVSSTYEASRYPSVGSLLSNSESYNQNPSTFRSPYEIVEQPFTFSKQFTVISTSPSTPRNIPSNIESKISFPQQEIFDSNLPYIPAAYRPQTGARIRANQIIEQTNETRRQKINENEARHQKLLNELDLNRQKHLAKKRKQNQENYLKGLKQTQKIQNEQAERSAAFQITLTSREQRLRQIEEEKWKRAETAKLRQFEKKKRAGSTDQYQRSSILPQLPHHERHFSISDQHNS